MNPSPSAKKRSVYISIILVLICIGGLHFFIVHRANMLLPGLIQDLTQGKYELKIKQVKFRYWNASIDFNDIALYPAVDSLQEEYRVKAESLHLKMGSIISLITGKNIRVRDLEIRKPAIDVMRNEKITRVIKRSELHVLIGSIQQSAIHFLHALQVDKCSVTDASFKYHPIPNVKSHYNIRNINIHLSDVHVSELENELSGKIKVSVISPDLMIPDSLKHIQLDRFVWDNENDLFEVGRFVISQRGKRNLSDSTKVELDALSVKKLYWEEWLKTGIVHVDSLMAENGNMYFSNSGTSVSRKRKDSIDLKKLKVWDVIGNLYVGYFSARKIKASVINTEQDWERDNTILGDSLVIRELKINPGLKNPLSIDDLAIGVESFVDKGKGKKLHTSFTGLRLQGDTLSLNNYVARTTAKSRFGAGTLLQIPVVKIIGLSVRDIMEKKAMIREIWMQNPYLKIKANSPSSLKFNDAIPANTFDELKSLVDVQKVFISNGFLDFTNNKEVPKLINIRNFNATILADKLMSSNTISGALNAVANSSFGMVQWKLGNNDIKLNDVKLDYQIGRMHIGSGDIEIDDAKLAATVSGLNVQLARGFNPLVPSKNWHFKWIQLDSGSVNLHTVVKDNFSKTRITGGSRDFLIDSMEVKHLSLDVIKSNWTFNGKVVHMLSGDLQILQDYTSWSNLNANVKNIHYASNEMDIAISRAELNPAGKSILSESNLFRETDEFSIKASLPLAITGTDFHDTKFNPMRLNYLGLSKPTVELFLNQYPDSLRVEEQLKKIFSVGNLMVDDPRLFVTVKKKDETVSFGTSGEKIRGNGIAVMGNRKISGFSIDQLSASFGISEVNATSKNIFRTGLIDFNVERISKEKYSPLQASIKKFNVGSFKLNRIKGKDTIEFRTGGVYLGEIPKIILQKDSILNTVFKLPPAEILPSTFTFKSTDKELSILNVTANTKEEFLKWDSLSFRNRLGRQEFFSSIPFEKDYITLSTGKVNAEILRPVIYGDDTTVFVHRLTINPLELKVERDKRVKDDTVRYRPLLARSLKKIPFPFRIDSILLQHSTIWHNIIDEKTSKEGTIFFKDVEGPISMVKNFDYQENDSLEVALDSKLMGKGALKFIFRQDYNDSLQTFLLNARMGSLDMKEINRLLQPLQNVRVEKGIISNLGVKAKGNDLLAYGTMDMFYDDLEVSVLRDDGKRDGFKSWLANILLRSDNTRSGILYTERAKDRAIFNFWGKIAINGLLTNLGVKKNNRQEKRFYRSLQKRQLPEDVF